MSANCCVAISPQARWRVIDGELAAYVADRAETHLLDSTAAWILSALADRGQPMARQAMVADWLDAVDCGAESPLGASEAASHFAKFVDSLVDIGMLIEVPC